MTTDKKGLKDFERYSVNPSCSDVRRVYGVSIVGQMEKFVPNEMFVNTETGEEVQKFVSVKGKKVGIADGARFMKVYKGSYPELMELSSSGLRILCYVFDVLVADRDEVEIVAADAMAWCKYRFIGGVYTGIIELLEAKFLFAKTGRSGAYFINVNKFFNGSRTKLQVMKDLQARLDGGEFVDLKNEEQ